MFNNYRKIGKFDIGSDIQNAIFSEKLDKNNWTQKNGLSHPGLGLRLPNLFFVLVLHRLEIIQLREVISGSKLNAQKSEK